MALRSFGVVSQKARPENMSSAMGSVWVGYVCRAKRTSIAQELLHVMKGITSWGYVVWKGYGTQKSRVSRFTMLRGFAFSLRRS